MPERSTLDSRRPGRREGRGEGGGGGGAIEVNVDRLVWFGFCDLGVGDIVSRVPCPVCSRAYGLFWLPECGSSSNNDNGSYMSWVVFAHEYCRLNVLAVLSAYITGYQIRLVD